MRISDFEKDSIVNAVLEFVPQIKKVAENLNDYCEKYFCKGEE